MKALFIKVGFYDAFVWSLNTNEVREVAAIENFNLNKTQSLNDALRAVYMEGEGGFRGPWRRVPKPTLTLVSPHIWTLKQPILKYFEITGAWPKNKVAQHLL